MRLITSCAGFLSMLFFERVSEDSIEYNLLGEQMYSTFAHITYESKNRKMCCFG